MDWVDEMREPAPAEFLRRAEQIPVESTGYVTVDLEPGRYAWIAEKYRPRIVVHEFTVK